MKLVLRFSLALLTFVLGVAISPIRFYVEGWGCGKVADGGGGYGITSYSSSYFVKLWSASGAYVSPEKADAVFNERLSQAVTVIETGPKVNKNGAVIGRRAMAIFYSPQLRQNYTEIFWTDGRILHYIGSTSTMHVKDFERQQR